MTDQRKELHIRHAHRLSQTLINIDGGTALLFDINERIDNQSLNQESSLAHARTNKTKTNE
jgi:hypothetical protein